MLSFAAPLFFLLLLLLPPVAWLHLRRRRSAIAHSDLSLFATHPPARANLVRYGGLALRLAALLFLVVALAGPRWPDLRTRFNTQGIALFMVVDASRSMAEPDFDWDRASMTRLDAVKKVFRLFVSGSDPAEPLPDGSSVRFQGREGDLVGLVTFAARPEVSCPLTLNHTALLHVLNVQQPRGGDEAATNISDALILALWRIKSAAPKRKVLVLLTDGEHNVKDPRSGWSPRQVARMAKALQVPVYTIDAGGLSLDEDEEQPLEKAKAIRDLSAKGLRDIAAITGGQYFEARNAVGLVKACREIDRLERSDIVTFQYRRYHEGAPWCALASFVLFTVALVLDRTMWRRLP